jgi:hypothetical protein
MRHIDADSSSAELLRRMDRRPAPAKRIEHQIALV